MAHLTARIGYVSTTYNTILLTISSLTGLAAGFDKLPLLRYLLETLKLPVNEPQYNAETKKNDGWTPAE